MSYVPPGFVAKKLRKQKGLRMKDVPQVHMATIGHFEQSGHCKTETLLRVAEALGVQPADLFVTMEQAKKEGWDFPTR